MMTGNSAPAPAGARTMRVWDPFVRVFHWSLAGLFLANEFLTEGESDLHEWFGYAILALIGARVVWGLVGPRPARFSAFPPSLGAARRHLAAMMGSGSLRPAISHNPLGALMVYNLLLTCVALGATGWMMTLDAFWGVEWVEETHEILANWGLISVGLHVAGVMVEQVRSRVDLVRAMITGDKTIPES